LISLFFFDLIWFVSVLLEFSLGTHVELILDLVVDLRKLLLLEKREKVPSLIQRLEDGSVLIVVLVDEFLLESVMELQEESIFICEGLLTDDCLHCLGIFTLGIESIHLVGNIWMIVSCHTFTDSTLHQSGKGWQDIDWWVNASLVHVSINVDLSLSDVTSQIWNWMGDIIIWHGQNWNLGDRSNFTGDSTSSLVDGGEIGVHVTWVTSSTGNLLSSS
jgi:hypothetical protein